MFNRITRSASMKGNSSQKTPKSAKKKDNSSFISVVESIVFPTSETPSSLKPVEDPSPQTLEHFDIEFDPSVTLENILNKPLSPNLHLEQNHPELPRVLSDIDQFDPDFQTHNPGNPNFQTPQTENPNFQTSNPENRNATAS
ncbi:unnamed protein product [Vicia faba]|uniref:Uncharacterized protein n=1 Tax=Vicia faba TaxID=3906 RepID=A0AAV1B222_VICFA|nr:unnamed protein product [Vicia faba]